MATATQTNDPGLTQLLTCLTLQPRGRDFSDQEKNFIRQFLQPKTVVFMAFPMKCGGTFLREVMARCLQRLAGQGSPVSLLRGSYMGEGDGERDLYFPGLFTHFAAPGLAPAILHNHTLATLTNRILVELFHLKPVVMQRSIADMMRSFYDVASKKQRFGGHGSGYAEDETFWDKPIEARKDYLIRNVAPWYVKFYASWMLSEKRGLVKDIHWVRFEDFREDCVAVAEGILQHHGLHLDRDQIQASVHEATALREKLRFNKGVSGRGESFFTPEQLQQIEALTEPYETIDFKARGLV